MVKSRPHGHKAVSVILLLDIVRLVLDLLVPPQLEVHSINPCFAAHKPISHFDNLYIMQQVVQNIPLMPLS